MIARTSGDIADIRVRTRITWSTVLNSLSFIHYCNSLGIQPVLAAGWTLSSEVLLYLLLGAALTMRVSVIGSGCYPGQVENHNSVSKESCALHARATLSTSAEEAAYRPLSFKRIKTEPLLDLAAPFRTENPPIDLCKIVEFFDHPRIARRDTTR